MKTNFNGLRPIEKFGLRLFVLDLAVVLLCLIVDLITHSSALPYEKATFKLGQDLTLSLSQLALATVLFVVWVLALAINKTWNPKLAGSGVAEYVMTTRASFAVLITVAFASLLMKVDVSRSFILGAFLLVATGLVAHRWANRQWLLSQRRKGRFVTKTMLVGPKEQLLEVATRLVASNDDGYKPVRAVVTGSPFSAAEAKLLTDFGMTLIGYEDARASDIDDHSIEAILIIGSDHISSERMKRISWALEGTKVQFIVAPALVDFAGERLTTKTVAGMPFLFVETPKFEGVRFLLKTFFDIIFALMALIAVSPIMLLTALAILIEDRGPIFYAQNRIGQNGKAFKMFKFRSMIKNADKIHAELRAKSSNQVNKRMFKDPNDPRLTRVGRFIRRFSIDELPQIFNVLNGTMSMVGPRPPLETEVAEYSNNDHRRLLVKPGITGLWQVSGRSTLSWEETVRLDLYYVENWSLSGDIFIILRTFKAVVSRNGAY